MYSGVYTTIHVVSGSLRMAQNRQGTRPVGVPVTVGDWRTDGLEPVSGHDRRLADRGRGPDWFSGLVQRAVARRST
jgi:hypothetical protein